MIDDAGNLFQKRYGMNNRRTTLERIAPTIEEAVAEGLSELNIPRDQVKVEILDEGTRGFLGMGNRQARVRLTVIEEGNVAEEIDYEKPQSEIEDTLDTSDLSDEILNVIEISKATVNELLKEMNVQATVSAAVGEEEDSRFTPSVILNIHGNDLSILIGKKAETLNSLQFITRLIVGKEIGRSANIIVDVENYRQRRDQNLRKLAQRMASQAVNSNRRQTLEPMPASERRVIHMELREHPDVYTESVGEEPKRKVSIIPR